MCVKMVLALPLVCDPCRGLTANCSLARGPSSLVLPLLDALGTQGRIVARDQGGG